MFNLPKLSTVVIAGALALVSFAPAPAQSSGDGAVFSVQRTSSGQVSAGAWAFGRGDYEEAERFGRVSLQRPERFSRSRRSIAYANWCAALSMTEEHELALDACEQAIVLRPTNWRAHLNHGSALLRSGDRALAQAAYAQARTLAPTEGEIVRAVAILESRSLASAD